MMTHSGLNIPSQVSSEGIMGEVNVANVQSASNPTGQAAPRIESNNEFFKNRQFITPQGLDGGSTPTGLHRWANNLLRHPPPPEASSARPHTHHTRSSRGDESPRESVPMRSVSAKASPRIGSARAMRTSNYTHVAAPAPSLSTTPLSSSRRNLMSALHMDADIDAMSKVRLL